MTIYRLARTPADYRACHRLLGSDKKLRFPTLMAERDGELVAFLATEGAYTDKIVAGPLMVKPGIKPAWLVLRLVDLYDTVMRQAGVKAYLFCTDNPRLLTWLAQAGVEPFTKQDQWFWFERSAA